jgi:translation initiation factor 3 subunit C
LIKFNSSLFLRSIGAKDVKKKDKPKRARPVEVEERLSDQEDQESVSAALIKERVLFAKDEEINLENVVKKLNEICSTRGRKGTDRREQIEILLELKEICKKHNLGQPIEVKILFNLIAMNFDYNPKLSKCMKSDSWNKYVETDCYN